VSSFDTPEKALAKHRQYRHAAFAALMNDVFVHMTEEERRHVFSLERDVGQVCNMVVAYALNHLDELGHPLAFAVVDIYSASPHGERFIAYPGPPPDYSFPVDKPSAMVFVDGDGELVRVDNPLIEWLDTNGSDYKEIALTAYKSYEVLTGPKAGQTFGRLERPLVLPPQHRTEPQYDAPVTTVSAERKSQPSRPLTIFLCHASEDKERVRELNDTLEAAGFEPWLDDRKILPGQDWDREIQGAVRSADVFIACLSSHSEKRGYVQKEIVRALSVAEELPEGSIFIIPARLESCNVPTRLTRWQWVDLFADDGLEKLIGGLQTVYSKVREAT
jgi:hypothetical protein